MKYKIKVNYNTGDSFSHTSGLEDEIDMGWENLDIVKENIKRISEHYKAHEKINSYSRRVSTWKDYKHERWYSEQYSDFSVMLLLDDGTEYKQSASQWSGYFESLNFVEVVSDTSDWKITF